MAHFKVDCVVVGGGISGTTSAAALAQEGFQVLLCEAGLPNDKRLAGELMHPPAAARLDALGLLEPLKAAGAMPVYGFVIHRGPDDPGTMLSYAEVPGGRASSVAADHALMTRTLLDAVEGRPGIQVWSPARVMDVRFDADGADVEVRRGDDTVMVRTRLVVSAEGRESKIRTRAGIEVQRTEPFRMLGWRIPNGSLPYPGFGHVFLGGPSAVLAYQVARDQVRIMFEVEMDEGTELSDALLAPLPQPFRDQVAAVARTERPQTARVYGLIPQRFTGSKLAVVGDAGGCVHPLSASGIAFCTADAVDLAASMKATRGRRDPVGRALARYERGRRGPMRTRATLGPALVEALSGDSPDLALLRHGLFRYWSESPRGRRRSMGLLSTHDHGLPRMVQEYATVAAYGISGIFDGVVPAREVPSALAGLARRTAGQVRAWRQS
ncbi:MAG: FAD-dependent monooxygenase [Myxococcales bacterium]|nr:FAD-dependent monooxygenase [Myxococcales bacterium]MCB9649452.1 FAD-dependent monooxygenase [Deltaproteobacteria bacterium]